MSSVEKMYTYWHTALSLHEWGPPTFLLESLLLLLFLQPLLLGLADSASLLLGRLDSQKHTVQIQVRVK